MRSSSSWKAIYAIISITASGLPWKGNTEQLTVLQPQLWWLFNKALSCDKWTPAVFHQVVKITCFFSLLWQTSFYFISHPLAPLLHLFRSNPTGWYFEGLQLYLIADLEIQACFLSKNCIFEWGSHAQDDKDFSSSALKLLNIVSRYSHWKIWNSQLHRM